MIERVARAIARRRYDFLLHAGVDMESETEGDYVDRTWPQFSGQARAAIEAMREEDLRLELAKRKFDASCRQDENGCLVWTGAIDRRDGYGRFYDGSGKTQTAYGFGWKYHHGEVPAGMVLDHVCRNRACVNHEHLRIVTNAENVLFGDGPTAIHARQEACSKGHRFDAENTYVRPDGARGCRECLREGHRRYRAKKRTLSEAPQDGRMP